jgi:hypothetical protein
MVEVPGSNPGSPTKILIKVSYLAVAGFFYAY